MKQLLNISIYFLGKIAYLLFAVIGFFYGLFTKPLNVGRKLYKFGVIYDIACNVIGGELLTKALGDGYGEVETISSRLGKNKRGDGRETKLGIKVRVWLNKLDPNHVEKSIE